MKEKKIINEFKLKIDGKWYHSILYEDNTVERIPLKGEKDNVQFRK